MTSKLQVTVPKAIAEQFNIRPGSDITWVPAGDSIRIVPPGRQRRRLTRDVRLGLFDEATRRHLERDAASQSPEVVGDRGWARDEMYIRGRAR